jgi:hypothetical protein
MFRRPGSLACLLFIASYLLFTLPVMSLPADSLRKDTLRHFQKLMKDTIRFAGYDWSVKDSKGERTGPGTNLFSGKKENVWTDAQGRLHLRITNRDDEWFCPEVCMVKTLGYGKYTFHLEAFPQVLDKDVVVGMFLYDHIDTYNHHSEMDVEISKWGLPQNLNTQFVVQPMEDKTHRFDVDLGRKSSHSIGVTKNKVYFRSWYPATGNSVNEKDETIREYRFKLKKPYIPDNEKAIINIWLFQTIEPDNLKEFEVVVNDFTFEPF